MKLQSILVLLACIVTSCTPLPATHYPALPSPPSPTREPPVTIEIVIPYRGQEATPTATSISIPSLPTVSADANTMLDYVNSARVNQNLPSLSIDTTLSYFAKLRADDLVDEYSISHHTPSYGYLDEMLRGTGVNCCQIGENIGRTTSLEQGHHEGLMASEGHRENILRPNFTSVGIGTVRSGSRIIIVEIFCATPGAQTDCAW